MNKIKNPAEMEPGTKIAYCGGDHVQYLEFLMVHPHNSGYVLLLDNLTQDAKKYYISNIKNGEFYTDFTHEDLLIFYVKKCKAELAKAEAALRELREFYNK